MVFCFSDLYSSRQDFVWIILMTIPQGDVRYNKTLSLVNTFLTCFYVYVIQKNVFGMWSRDACKSQVQILNENILEVTSR